MKKLIYLTVLALVLGLVLTGCSLLSNISQVPATEQSGITYLTKTFPPTGLVGLWRFNGDADDSSDYDNHGTVYGGENYVDSPMVQALSFDGINDYVEIENDSSLNITQGTWEAWIKFDALPSVAGHPMNPLAKANQYWIHGSRNDPDSSTTDAIVVKIRVGGIRYCAKTSDGFITVGLWYHVAGTYDGEILKLYVNGTLVDSNPAPSGDIETGTQIMAVGTWSTLIDYFQGTIDEVRIWNRALTDNELIRYGFNGLLAPYKEPPKAFKLGRSIPLKWQYTNSADTVVDNSLADPRVRIVATGEPPPEVTEALIVVDDPGESGLQYDLLTYTWQFNWQTKDELPGSYDIYITSVQTNQVHGPFEILLQ